MENKPFFLKAIIYRNNLVAKFMPREKEFIISGRTLVMFKQGMNLLKWEMLDKTFSCQKNGTRKVLQMTGFRRVRLHIHVTHYNKSELLFNESNGITGTKFVLNSGQRMLKIPLYPNHCCLNFFFGMVFLQQWGLHGRLYNNSLAPVVVGYAALDKKLLK